ncbi:hypothetical protein pb186bvf_014677 [Paramecium bursaria]
MMHFRIKSNNRPSTTATRFDVSAQFSKISKQNTTPKLYKDKENLQDENIQLKLQLNQTKVELQKSKLVNIQLEKELQRFEQIVDDQVKLGDSSTKNNLERQGLVYKLKNKQKQLVQELIDKTKELDNLKKSTKQTYITELEIELQNYQEETIRLRQQLEYVQQIIDLSQQGETIEKKYLQQEKTLQILHKDNTQLNQQLLALENQLKGLKNKLEEQAKIIIQQSNEINQNAQTISELKDYIQQQNQKESKQPLNSQYHMEQIKLENIQIIENLKRLAPRIIRVLSYQYVSFKIKEIRELNTEIYRLKYKVQELEQLLESEPRHEFMSTPIQFDSIKEERDDVKVRPYVELKQPVSAKKRLPKVQYFEIKPIAMRLKINLFKNNKPYEQLDEIFDDLGQDISIYQCKELLSKWPFNLTDRNEVLLISRYLVEDNQDDYVIFDESRNNNVAVVKSIIKKIIGKYTLYQQDEEKQIIASIKKKINSSLNETIQLIVAKKKHLPNGCCEPQDFEQALKFHEIVFTQREQELIDMILFDQSQSLEVVNYNKFLQYFSKKEQE